MEEKKSASLPYVKSFKELFVYQKARTLAREVFEVTKSFPREEAYSLTDQWRRAARSVGAQIAEAWAKRRYPRHFLSKLSDADGEQQESQHWTIMALDAGYLSRDQARDLGLLAQEVGRMLGEMIEKHESFCVPQSSTSSELHDDTATYFVTAASGNALEAEPDLTDDRSADD